MKSRSDNAGANPHAYVTAASSDGYAYGCLVLGHALRKTGSTCTLVALVTDDVSWTLSQLLEQVFDVVQRTPKIDSDCTSNGSDIATSLSKIHCWRLTQFRKCVFLNADTLVLQNCDELFERCELSAVPDNGWPDCFNCGVFVFEPSMETYWSLINLVRGRGYFDGGDERILNEYFNVTWRRDIQRRLPFIYNLVCSNIYSYAPAFHRYGSEAKIVQFVGLPKPWMVSWNPTNGVLQPSTPLNHSFHRFFQDWVDIFIQKVFPSLPEVNKNIVRSRSTVQAIDMLHLKPLVSLGGGSSSALVATSAYFNVANQFSQTSSHLHKFSLPTSQAIQPICFDSTERAESFQQKEEPQPSHSSTPMYSGHINSESEFCHREDSNEPIFSPVTPSAPTMVMLPDHHDDDTIARPQAVEVDASTNPIAHPQNFITEASVFPPAETVSKEVPVPRHRESKSDKMEDETRMKRWEKGDIDYLGQDTFDNIWKRLSSLITQPGEPAPEQADPETSMDQPSLSSLVGSSVEQFGDASSDGSNSSLEESSGSLIEIHSIKSCQLPGYAYGDYDGMHEWEQGRIDYTGRDSSENIMKRLDYLIIHKDFLQTTK